MNTHRTLVTDRLTWHIVSRGWRGTEIFRDEHDFASFREILGEKARATEIPILAYCLMSNHFHILLASDGPTLAAFAKRLKVAHARRFNLRHLQYGTLFEGRYASIPVFGARNLAYVSAYIHQNPVTAGIGQDALAYPWSSARETDRQMAGEPWLDPAPVMAAVREVMGADSARYRDYLTRWVKERSAAFPDTPPGEGPGSWVFERRVEVLRRFFGHLCELGSRLTDGNPASRGLAVSFGVWITMHSGGVPAAAVAMAAGFRGPLSVYAAAKRTREWRSRSPKHQRLAREFMGVWPEFEGELRDLRGTPDAA